jgi:AcrR family transcriptional regulator
MPGKRLPEEERREAILDGAFRVAVRDQLGGLSMRAVAEEAGVSKGLLFFHFDDKEHLLLALLDWVLERGPRVHVPPALAESDAGDPATRLLDLLEHQIAGLPGRRERAGLFLDFWVKGTGMPEFRHRIRDGFDRYRAEFVPWARPVVEQFPDPYDGDTAEGLAAVLVSFIQGCALQLISDPEGFDVDRYMRAVRGLVLHAGRTQG